MNSLKERFFLVRKKERIPKIFIPAQSRKGCPIQQNFEELRERQFNNLKSFLSRTF